MVFKPMMTPIEAQRRLDWQDRVYQRNKARGRRVEARFGRRRLIVPEQVIVPVPARYNLLAQAVARETRTDDRVLDLGTGSGVQGIIAASRGGRVAAVDVNPYAVRSAVANARRNRLDGRMTVFASDLFSRVRQRFDLIIFDPPFRWSKPRDLWERSTADEHYRTLEAFFASAKRYLRPRGRILIHFGSSADMVYFRHLVRHHRWRCAEVARGRNSGWTYHVFRLAP